jgi:hypothetical protein
MTRLRATATRAVGSPAEIVVCIGDAAGARRGWFAPAAGPIRVGEESEVPESALFPCPSGAGDDEMLGLLSHWPAWRVTRLARLELGSRLLVVGGGWLSARVLEFARLWGCVWRAASGPADLRDRAEFWTEQANAEALRRILPAKPDAAILLGDSPDVIAPALAACQDRGTIVLAVQGGLTIDLNLYPDAHRRSLRVVGCEPLTRHAVSDAEIADGFDRIAALLATSALARG